MPIDAADVEPFPNAQAKHNELFKVLRGRYGLIARPRHTPVVDGHPHMRGCAMSQPRIDVEVTEAETSPAASLFAASPSVELPITVL